MGLMLVYALDEAAGGMTVARRGVRRWLIAGLPGVLALFGCAPSVVSMAPPPVRERTLPTFADAASALDWARAEALAVTHRNVSIRRCCGSFVKDAWTTSRRR